MGLNRDLGNIPEVVTVFNGNFGIGTNLPQSKVEVSGSGYFPQKLITLSGAEPTRYNANIGTNIVGGSQIALSFGTRSNNTNYDNSLNIYNGRVLIGTISDNGSSLQVNGNISATSLRLSGNYNTTVVTDSNWSSYQTMIPTGTLSNNATYLISVRWDFGSGSNQPYYCYCSFLFQGAFTNSGGGTDNEFTPMCSTHTGGMGSTISFRAVAGIATTAGIQARLNNFATRGGTLTVRAILLE